MINKNTTVEILKNVIAQKLSRPDNSTKLHKLKAVLQELHYSTFAGLQ